MRKFCFKICLVLSIILLMVNFSLAQSPREPISSEGKTGFVNISVSGLNVNGTDGLVAPGVPGYIEMVSTKGDTFYLYIGYDGALRIASDVAVGYGASPSTVSWGDASAPLVRW